MTFNVGHELINLLQSKLGLSPEINQGSGLINSFIYFEPAGPGLGTQAKARFFIKKKMSEGP